MSGLFPLIEVRQSRPDKTRPSLADMVACKYRPCSTETAPSSPSSTSFYLVLVLASLRGRSSPLHSLSPSWLTLVCVRVQGTYWFSTSSWVDWRLSVRPRATILPETKRPSTSSATLLPRTAPAAGPGMRAWATGSARGRQRPPTGTEWSSIEAAAPTRPSPRRLAQSFVIPLAVGHIIFVPRGSSRS